MRHWKQVTLVTACMLVAAFKYSARKEVTEEFEVAGVALNAAKE